MSCPIADIPYDEKLRVVKSWTIIYVVLTTVTIRNASTFAKIKLCKQHIGYQYTEIGKNDEDVLNEAYYMIRRFIWNYCCGHDDL